MRGERAAPVRQFLGAERIERAASSDGEIALSIAATGTALARGDQRPLAGAITLVSVAAGFSGIGFAVEATAHVHLPANELTDGPRRQQLQ